MGKSKSTEPWLEKDSEFEGVGAHRDNPRYNHEAALEEQRILKEREEPDVVE